MTDLRHLLEQLRRGERPPLSVDDVELLLGWLTGSAAREGSEGADLPAPGHDPVLLQMVLHRLDDVLFDGGELRPAAAGLDPSEPATRRRIRFRRLASAFHPDRFPDLADWLTQRSQAVHRAYARFKQDPDGPVAAPSPVRPHPPPHGPGPGRQDMRRAAPRVRKHRIRAFGNRLRARFGNDRYLAHKLIGGLALLALLPVLNMVLVPGKDPVDGLRSTVEQEETGSGFRVPGSGENQDGGTASSEPGFVGAVSGRDDSAPEPPPTENPAVGEDVGHGSVGAGSSRDDRNPESRIAAAHGEATDSNDPARKASTVNRKPEPQATDPEITPLLAAARRAMNPNGEIATVAALQTVDEQLAAMGLENDTERLYRRIGGGDSVDADESRGGAAAGSGVDRDAVDVLRVTVDAGDSEATGAAAGNAEDVRTPTDPEASLARQAPTSVADLGADENAQSGSESSTGVGAGLAGDDGGSETQSLARQAPTPVAGSGAAEDPQAGPETSTGVGAGLAGDDVPADAWKDSVGAASGRDESAQNAPPTTSEPDSQSLARQAPTSVEGSGAGEDPQTGSEPSTGVGAGLAGDDEGPEPRIASVPTEAAETDPPARKPETGNPKPAPEAQSAQDAPPTTSRTANRTANREASQPANQETSQPDSQRTGDPAPQAQSDLALGLLATHPAGEVLKRLHAALVAGNIPGIAGAFAPDARMASLRGRDEIADHFRAGFDSADSRQVTLKVLRLGREDDGWRVEADLDVRVSRDAATHALVAGRSSFLLVERGDRMLIDRMELE